MGIDDYMTIFEEGERRAQAPTSDQSSERDLNVPEPDLPGYLESVTALPGTRAATAALYQQQAVQSRPSTRLRASSPALFAYSTGSTRVRTAAVAGRTSPPSLSPATGAPLPPPPDAPPPPPDAPSAPTMLPASRVNSLVTNVPGTTVAPAPASGGLGGLIALGAIGALAWWFFGTGSEDDEKRSRGRGTRGLGDEAAVRELELYMDSTQDVAVRMKGPYERNAMKWKRLGKYDPKKAPRLWFFYVEKGIAAYNREHGEGSMRLSKEEKMQLAREYAREWESKNGISTAAE